MIEASVLVVGAGAIGGVTAAKMTGEVDRVAVLDADGEHVERMREEGVFIDDLGEERRVRLEAHADPAELDGPFDFALITLKAPHLESALGPLRDLGLVDTFVSLGNGLVQERVAGIVGGEHLIWGTVEWGATNLGPGRLARTTRGPFIIGEPDGSVRERTRLLAGALDTVDEASVTQNIRGQVRSSIQGGRGGPRRPRGRVGRLARGLRRRDGPEPGARGRARRPGRIAARRARFPRQGAS